MKKLLAAGIAAVILSSTPSALAQDPAPAAAPAKPAWMAYQTPYAGEESDVANPHRTPEEVAAWSQQTSVDVLSFAPGNYQGKMDGFKKYFTASGWQLYSAYLKNAHVLETVTDNKYSVGAVVTDAPEIVNHAAADGAYHWIVKLPLTISFFKAGGNSQPVTSGKYVLFMDVQHVAESSGNNGVAINNWRVDDAAKGR